MFLNSALSKKTAMEEMDPEGSPGYMGSKIRSLSRDELVTVLKKRKHYQKEAADEAVREALRRGIIRSEEELESPEFEDPESRFTLFPCPENSDGRNRLFRSLLRGLMLAGLIPVIYGVSKFVIPKYAEGAGLISLGVIWIGMAWFIMERQEKRLILPMFLLIFMSMAYAVRLLFFFEYLKVIDLLVPIVLFVLIFYFLFYVRSLLRTSRGAENRPK